MPNPAPFLWTMLSMTLALCKLGEHGLTPLVSPSQIWML